MVQQLTWQSLSHQLRILNEGSSLLTKIFSNSNQREISVEDLALLPEYKEGTADILIKYGVLVEDNGFVGIENPHLDYFLESQAGNHHISLLSRFWHVPQRFQGVLRISVLLPL